MTCHDARELFSAHLDGALEPEARAGLEAHLAGCPDCRRELVRFEATVALLHAVEPARAPVGFVDRVLEHAAPVPWYARWRSRWSSPAALRRPIEVTVVALVALTAVYLYERTPEPRQAARESAPPAPTVSTAPAAPAPPRAEPLSRSAPVVPPPAPPQKKREAAGTRDARGNVAKAPAEEPAPSAAAPTVAAPVAAPPAASSESAPTHAQEAEQAEQQAKTTASPRAGPSGVAGRLAASADASGTLAVTDRAAAAGAIAELVTRLGGAEAARRADADTMVVELLVPGAKYRELAEGLARIGRWRPDREPVDPSAQVRVTLRLVAG